MKFQILLLLATSLLLLTASKCSDDSNKEASEKANAALNDLNNC